MSNKLQSIICLLLILIVKGNFAAAAAAEEEPCLEQNVVTEFTGKINLDRTTGYNLSYLVQNSSLFLKLEIENQNSNGWMGFGIPEQGTPSMLGSDIVTVQINNGAFVVTDRHVQFDSFPLDVVYPEEDSCQDWELVDGDASASKWSVTIKRKLETNDSDDRKVISTGAHAFVYAFGTGSFGYHGSSVGISSVDFSSPTSTSSFVKPSDATSLVELKMNNYTVRSTSDTFYACQGFDLSSLIDLSNPRHVVAVEPLIVNKKYVHHILLHACGATSANPYALHENGNPPDECQGTSIGVSPLGQGSCQSLVFGWAVGGGAFILPENVGIQVSNTSLKFLLLEIHYNNPDLETIVDTSGVRIHMTSANSLRSQNGGSLTLGALAPGSDFNLGPNAIHHREATCTAVCTNKWSGAITVFASFLHTHAYGKQLWTTHYPANNRSNGTVRHRIDFWSFEHQQTVPITPYTINKGDSLSTHGVYDTLDHDQTVVFGDSSYEEMLFDFVFVFPIENLGGRFFCGRIPTQNGPLGACSYNFNGNIDLTANPNPDGVTSLPLTFFTNASQVCSNSSLVTEAGMCSAPTTTSTTKSPTFAPTNSSSKTLKSMSSFGFFMMLFVLSIV